MAKRGRKHKLTRRRVKTIVDALRDGNTRRAAAHLADIHERTLIKWLNRGRACEDGDEVFADLLDQVQKAEAEAEAAALAKVADSDAWQAAAWYLERRYPAEYGRHARVELSSDAPVEIVVEIGGQRDDGDS